MASRKPLIAGNWKMYKTPAEAAAYAAAFLPLVAGVAGRDVMLAPPYPALAAVADALKGSSVGLGAQDLFWETEGAFTGQVSPRMLCAVGCRYAIVGHSERRQFFGETDATVNRKTRAALAAGLVPIVCVGESEAEREAGQTFSILDKQLQGGLQGFSANDIGPRLGHRHRQNGDLRPGRGGAPLHPLAGGGALRGGGSRGDANPVRGQRQARQHRRAHGHARHRRRPGRRRQPEPGVVREDRAVQIRGKAASAKPMTVFLVIIHVIVCVALIMIVLLQTGKGADIGAAFGGGGSNTLFGTSGASTFLSKATTVAAIVFMITSLTLAYLSSQRQTTSVVTEAPAVESKAAEAAPAPAPAAPPAAAETKPETPAKQ